MHLEKVEGVIVHESMFLSFSNDFSLFEDVLVPLCVLCPKLLVINSNVQKTSKKDETCWMGSLYQLPPLFLVAPFSTM